MVTEVSIFWLVRLLALLRAVLGTTLAPAVDAEAVKRATDDMVSHTGQVTDAAATYEDDGVFLKVVTFAADVSGNFLAVAQTHTRNFAQRGIRLLRGYCLNLKADAASLGARVKVFDLTFGLGRSAGLSH